MAPLIGAVVIALTAAPAVAAEAPSASPTTAERPNASPENDQQDQGARPSATATTPRPRECTGLRLDAVPIRLADKQVATLEVFYADGFNCAHVRLEPSHVAAKPRPPVAPFKLYVALQRCAATAPGPLCRDLRTIEDTGRYFRFAGPVRVFAPGRCVRAEGRVLLRAGVEAYAETRPGASFCG